MGAPTGNQNAARAAQFRSAIERAVALKSSRDKIEALDVIAMQMIESAMDESLPLNERLPVWKELADRLDGKPKASAEITGADGAPLVTSIAVRLIRAGDSPDP